MARDRQTVISDAVAIFEGIGSAEVGRHVVVALNRQALKSRDLMRQSVRDVMGKGVSGPGALFARGAPTAYTVNSIQATQTKFADGMDGAEVSVFVAARQGSKGHDQSAYLKFYFGDGVQTRPAGDVGMSDDQVTVPQVEALALTQHMGGLHVGGPQRGGLMRYLGNAAAPSGVSRSEAMRNVALGAATARAANARDRERMSVSDRLRLANEAYGQIALRRRLEAAARAGATLRSAMAAHARIRDSRDTFAWGVFKGPDKASGLPAFFARPARVRDPAGGYHTMTRRDGRTSRMPDMLTIAPEYGRQGIGPVALTRARASVSHVPVLQEPWEHMAKTSADVLFETLGDEYAHALERKSQGRSY